MIKDLHSGIHKLFLPFNTLTIGQDEMKEGRKEAYWWYFWHVVLAVELSNSGKPEKKNETSYEA